MIINDIEKFLAWVAERELELTYDADRHKIRIYAKHIIIGDLWLPFSLSFDPKKNEVYKVEKNWVIFLVRAGTAAVGYFEEGINTEHKVFRAYMVRKNKVKAK